MRMYNYSVCESAVLRVCPKYCKYKRMAGKALPRVTLIIWQHSIIDIDDNGGKWLSHISYRCLCLVMCAYKLCNLPIRAYSITG